jgi:hypothetical protein
MKDIAKIIGVVIIGSFVLCVLAFAFTGANYTTYKFWAPKQANAERVVFENTQSYVEGKSEYISRLRFQYQQADGAQKNALRTLILSEASTVDNSKLPADVQGFIAQLKGQF